MISAMEEKVSILDQDTSYGKMSPEHSRPTEGMISAQYDHPITMASLFDGIGGFPLVWEEVNGKGSALWASEIEEFPIAVTKIRFPEEE